MVAVDEDMVATPEVKNAPIDPGCQPSNELPNSENLSNGNMETSEFQPNKDLSNSRAAPNKDLPASEVQASDVVSNGGTSYHELDKTKESPNIKLQNSESLATDQTSNAEVPDNNQPVDSETPLNNPSANFETPTDNQPVCYEGSLDKKPASKSSPNNLLVNFKDLPDNGVVKSELQTTDDVVVSETQHNEVPLSPTQQSNELVMSESQPSNEVVMSETQPSNEPNEAETCNDVVMTKVMPGNVLATFTTYPNNQLSHPEAHFRNHHFNDFHIIAKDQLPQPESLPNCSPLPSSEPLTDSHIRDIKPIPHNHLAQYDTVPNNHLDHSMALSNHELTGSETLSHGQLANSQMLQHYELENNGTLHENQLVSSQAPYDSLNPNTVPSYEIVNAENTPETRPYKRRKEKSIVWEHFTIVDAGAGCRRASCNQCKQTFAYSTGSKVAGTSHLKRHIAKGTCSALLRSQDRRHLNTCTLRSKGSGAGNASSTPKRRYGSSSTPYIIFDQDRCRHEIARMIIMHDYPLHMVEHPGFVAFVQNLQPQFNMVTFNTVQGDCLATYLMEKQHLLKYFEGLGRLCLTLDTWMSNQSVGYVFITGHFVDSDWKLQRRILNVVMEPYPDSDSAINHAVAVCISDWNLEGKLFSITSNQTLSEAALGNLRSLLSLKNPLILNGQLLVGHCVARTFSIVANDLLSSVQGIVEKIRDSVKYVKTSESHEEKFLELKQQLQVPSEKSLFIDDQTQWNTTYQMLVAASELKEVFSCLDTYDPDYKGAPSMQDWKIVGILCTYLKPLYDATNILTTTTHPTAITFFHEVWKLQLDLARAVVNEDPFIINLTKPMQEKINNYWRDCSLVLAIAVVMDPRFKMKLVEFSFTKVYGDEAHVYIKIVKAGIHELFHEYATLPQPPTQEAYAEGEKVKMEGSLGGILGLTDFDAYIMETSSQQMKCELDQYLEEALLPRVHDFDVLGWWKLNKLKYPTLSKMARDILSVPVSSVPTDSVFDTKSKEMDQYRSSLRPETVEALVCAKDWMHYRADEALNALVKMEF